MKKRGAFAAALVIWTLLSFGYLTVFNPAHVCRILQVVPPGGFHGNPPPLTQAEMDAQTAACGGPRPDELILVGAGYTVLAVILVAGLYMTAGAREISADP